MPTTETHTGQHLQGCISCYAAVETPTLGDEAHDLMVSAIGAHGRGELSCAWCGMAVFVDNDSIGYESDIRTVAQLIEHARYDHASPADILFTAPIIILKGARA